MPAVSLWILVSGFLFTLMSMSAKICANYFTLFEILFWRSLFGIVCVASLMIYQGVPFPTKHPMAHIKRCVAGILCFLLEIWALCYLPLSVEQPISYLSPLLFCSFFVISSRRTGDRIDWPVIGAVVLGFIGVLFIHVLQQKALMPQELYSLSSRPLRAQAPIGFFAVSESTGNPVRELSFTSCSWDFSQE